MPLGRFDTSRFRAFASAALSIALTASPVLRADQPVSPQPAAITQARNARAAAEAEVPLVRMNFISTSWEKVLEHVAEETGSQLVVHDLPPGRYSRRDLKRYNRTQAVQILNQELEPQGYRVLEKDKFLTVIQIQRARVEYPRATYGSGEHTDGIRGSRPAAAASPAPFPGAAQRVAQPVARGPQPTASEILLVGQETPAADSADEGSGAVTVKTERPIIEVAQQLYAAFRERAELVQTGPDELPAFRVYRSSSTPADPNAPPAEREVWFTIAMDTAAGEFHIQAEEKVAASLVALIKTLDRPAVPGETMRIVPDTENAEEMARQLDAQFGQPENGQRREPGLPDEAEVPPEALGNLRGDVSVESLADLDLLIIRGNERDVEAVLAVINIIEDMAIGATPGILLFFLNNVDSEALATLLNDVYQRLTTLSAGTAASARQTRAVAIVPVVRPNAILILAPQNSMESIVELAEQLDQPVTPGTEAEVFFLRNAVASQVVTQLETFYQDRVGLGTQIRIVADVRTNSVIVNASPSELVEVSRVIRQIDRGPKAVAQMRVVPLQNALADEMAEFLNSIIQGVINPAQVTGQQQFGAQGGDQALRDSKSVVLEFLTTDGSAQRLIRSGLLTDVRITGDIRTNTLTVTAPQASMPMVLELVRTLDQPTNMVADIKVFPLRNADAASAAELLLTLFPEGEAGQPGVQVAGAAGFGSALVPLRVSVDPRTNTVIAIGSLEVLQIVDAVLFRIDQDDARNRRTEVLRLRNSPANDVAIAINQFLQSQRDLLQIDPTRISTSQILEQEIIVTPEPISNNLIISATPTYFETVYELARQLDREPAQVMIQALIVEVTLDDTDEFGVELGFQDSVLFNRSVADTPVTITQTNTLPNGTQTTTQQIISQTAIPGFLFNNAPLGNNIGGNTSSIGTQGLSNFALGRLNNDLGFGGLVLSASSEAVSALLRALSAQRNVQILSRPQILALDNQLAQIQVGQQVPIVNGFNTNATTGVANPLVTYDPAGIILTVTPRISPEGQIVMEVIAEKSAFTGAGVPIFTDATSGNVIESPIKDITTALTSVKVPDGQTIVVGGMITRSEDVLSSKVPYLGDIPLVGNLFRYDSRKYRRTELLIFLTPRIIRGDSDVELIKQVEMERLHFFEDEAEMIHGPLMGVPSSRLAPLGADEGYPFAEPGMIIDPQMMGPQIMDPLTEPMRNPTPANPRLTPVPPAPGPTFQREAPPAEAPGVLLLDE